MFRSIILSTLCSLLFFAGCKKGEDDPFISLSGRKARMAGSWELTSCALQLDSKEVDTLITQVFQLRTGGLDVVSTTNGVTTNYLFKYSLHLNMAKDGSFDFTENIGNTQLKASGRWSFNSGAGESKKKSDVVYIISDLQNGATGNFALFNRGNTNVEYFIRELRNKKLVLETSSFIFLNSNGDFMGMKGILEFTQ